MLIVTAWVGKELILSTLVGKKLIVTTVVGGVDSDSMDR